MSGSHRHRRTRRLLGRLLPASLLLALAAVVAVPGVASALFSRQPSAQTASVTAATIGAPTNFTATATGSTTASLSWTAPPTLTGYTLTQSPGTVGGSCASLTASSTSCTATGLSGATAYTWTLTAVYNNWKSASAQASATTSGVGATLLGSATDGTSGTSSSNVNGITTTSGATLLILVYRSASDGNLGINSISGSAVSTTPAPTQINAEPFVSGHLEVFAWRATGSGTANGTVTVTFSKGNNTSTTIDVVQLSGNNTTTPVAGSAVSTNTGTTATGGTLSPGNSADGEVFFAGLSSASSMTTPSGYTVLDAPASTVHGSWFSSSATSTAVSTTLGASNTWGTIEIEISHA
jgi:hypothetical protein